MKERVLQALQAAGAFAPFRIANRRKALILMYHRFSERDHPLATSAESFSEQIDYLLARYDLVSLSRLFELLKSRREFPSRLAVITIDDGYRDAFEIAFPILKRKNVPATLFAVSGFIDGRCWLWPDNARFAALTTRLPYVELELNGHLLHFRITTEQSRLAAAELINETLKQMTEDERALSTAPIAAAFQVELPQLPPEEFAPMSWEQLRELDSAGIEIGSHTATHPVLTKVSDVRLREELVESRSRIESQLGRAVDLFCYPNGDSSDVVRREVARAGYCAAVTTQVGLNDGKCDPLSLRRVSTAMDMAHFAQSTSGFELFKDRLFSPRALASHARS